MKELVRQNDQKRPKKGKNLAIRDDNFVGSCWKIFDISLFSRDKFQVLNILNEKLASGTKKYWIATINPEFVMEAEKDSDFKRLLTRTDLNVMDGIGLVWARELEKRFMIKDLRFKNKAIKFLLSIGVGVEVLWGKYKDQVASGADLILELTKMAAEKDKKIFLLGGWQDRAEKTARFLKKEFGLKDDQISWCVGEPVVKNEDVVGKINKFKPDILLVAYGMKKQECWINDNLEKLDVGLVMGVGRSFDYYSGELKRAPNWVRKIGMEWFYSLIKEPSRFKRQLVLPKFVGKVIK